MAKNFFSLEGKVAIVTGCKKGIGKAIAFALAEAGADVAVCTRVLKDPETDLEAVAEEIRNLGRRSLAVQADVTKRADVEKLVKAVKDKFGKIDILVNNVGAMVRKPLMEDTDNDWDKVMDINLRSTFLCCQLVGKIMVAQKSGSIINMSSVCAVKSSVTRGAYHVAKAGVSMLTQTLGLELAGLGVRVNAIAPGGVKTDWNTVEWNSPENLKRPMKRMAETSEITGAAIFLASDASGYMTGHILLVDGGESL